jgi:hypothetical protein
LQNTSNQRRVDFVNNSQGMILQRNELINNTLNRYRNFYYVSGQRIGDISNDGSSREDYVTSMATSRKTPVEARYFTPVSSADFDQNYEPINQSYPSSAPTTYTVNTGDALQAKVIGNTQPTLPLPVSKQQLSMLKEVCVENNTKVYVKDFQPDLVNRLETYGVKVPVLEPEQAIQCTYVLKYNADEEYNLAMTLTAAELKLYQGNQRIGFAEYKLQHNRGLNFSKYQSNGAKINRLVDNMLLSARTAK